MPSSIVPNRTVDQIVHQCNDTRTVSEKRAPSRHAIQHAIQPQLRRRIRWTSIQPLGQAPCTAKGERSKISDASAVAEVVGPAARGKGGLRARQGGECRVFESEVVEGVLVEVRKRMKAIRVGVGIR